VQDDGKWVHVKETTEIGEGKLFAPGNLRATFDNPEYEKLVSYWLGEKYTLRYTGGMVPDVFQIIVKERGALPLCCAYLWQQGTCRGFQSVWQGCFGERQRFRGSVRKRCAPQCCFLPKVLLEPSSRSGMVPNVFQSIVRERGASPLFSFFVACHGMRVNGPFKGLTVACVCVYVGSWDCQPVHTNAYSCNSAHPNSDVALAVGA
jgi:hypothetical protein